MLPSTNRKAVHEDLFKTDKSIGSADFGGQGGPSEGVVWAEIAGKADAGWRGRSSSEGGREEVLLAFWF